MKLPNWVNCMKVSVAVRNIPPNRGNEAESRRVTVHHQISGKFPDEDPPFQQPLRGSCFCILEILDKM